NAVSNNPVSTTTRSRQTMKNTPKGWPRISPAIIYDDAAGAIDWLCRAFGFEVRIKVEGDKGRIEHSELVIGDGVVMVATSNMDAQPGSRTKRTSRVPNRSAARIPSR